MIGLDTNVIARLFVDDDAHQVRLARQFVAERCSRDSPGYIDRVALCELIWVLTSVHGYGRNQIVVVVEQLLASTDILLEDHESVRRAAQIFAARNVDFADALIGEINRARGCEATVTFDKKAGRLDGFVSLA